MKRKTQTTTNSQSVVEQVEASSKRKFKKKKGSGILIPTGATILDLIIGGGYPTGIVNLVGDSSTGKSFLAGETIANSFYFFKKKKKKLQWEYDNAEKGYTVNTKKLYGIDILGGGFFKKGDDSETIEDFDNKIDEIIKKKDKDSYFIYILDSFDKLTSEDEKKHEDKERKKRKKKADSEDGEGPKESGTYGLAKQKYMHKFCRLHMAKFETNNILLIIISQVKVRIGFGFGSKYVRLGGKALDFYPSIVVWFAEVMKYKKKGRAIGLCIKARTSKARNDKPYREGFIDLVFDYGLDNITSNINFLYDLKSDKGEERKKKLDWDNVDYTKPGLIKHIEKHNLEDELEQKVIKKWDDIEESISSKWRKPRW